MKIGRFLLLFTMFWCAEKSLRNSGRETRSLQNLSGKISFFASDGYRIHPYGIWCFAINYGIKVITHYALRITHYNNSAFRIPNSEFETHALSSAPSFASSLSTRFIAASACSSVSVPSCERIEIANATDFLPSPTCLPL